MSYYSDLVKERGLPDEWEERYHIYGDHLLHRYEATISSSQQYRDWQAFSSRLTHHSDINGIYADDRYPETLVRRLKDIAQIQKLVPKGLSDMDFEALRSKKLAIELAMKWIEDRVYNWLIRSERPLDTKEWCRETIRTNWSGGGDSTTSGGVFECHKLNGIGCDWKIPIMKFFDMTWDRVIVKNKIEIREGQASLF